MLNNNKISRTYVSSKKWKKKALTPGNTQTPNWNIKIVFFYYCFAWNQLLHPWAYLITG